MTKAQIKAYAEEMIAVAEVGGKLTPAERSHVVQQAMMICGRPDDDMSGDELMEEKDPRFAGYGPKV